MLSRAAPYHTYLLPGLFKGLIALLFFCAREARAARSFAISSYRSNSGVVPGVPSDARGDFVITQIYFIDKQFSTLYFSDSVSVSLAS